MPLRKLPEPMVPFTGKPPCFDSERQWVEWQTLERSSLPGGNRRLHFGPCTDCSLGYQRRMTDANRCARPWLDLAWVVARADSA